MTQTHRKNSFLGIENHHRFYHHHHHMIRSLCVCITMSNTKHHLLQFIYFIVDIINDDNKKLSWREEKNEKRVSQEICNVRSKKKKKRENLHTHIAIKRERQKRLRGWNCLNKHKQTLVKEFSRLSMSTEKIYKTNSFTFQIHFIL